MTTTIRTNRNRLTETQRIIAGRAAWLSLAIAQLDAEQDERGYVYKCPVTGEKYLCSEKSMLLLGKMLERGDDEADAYSHWCNIPGTGELA